MARRNKNTQRTTDNTITPEDMAPSVDVNAQASVDNTDQTASVSAVVPADASSNDITPPTADTNQDNDTSGDTDADAGDDDSENTTPEIPDNVSPALYSAVTRYINNMSPNNIVDAAKGSIEQLLLQQGIILAIVNADSDDAAVNNIRYMLDEMHNNPNVFNTRMLFRFYNTVKWPTSTARREIENILEFLMATANPETRQRELKLLGFDTVAQTSDPVHAEVLVRRIKAAYGQ